MTSRSAAATRSRSGSSASSTDRRPSTLHLRLPPTPSKYARHRCAHFAILSPVGAGVVRVGAIGKEHSRLTAGSPRAVRFKAFIRCNGSIEIPLMFCSELLHAKDASILGASFGAYSEQVLSGTSVECVPEGRALFPFER